MKKVVSLLLTIAVAFALFVPVSFADAENKTVMYDAESQPNWAETNIDSSTTQTGYLGKDATDESVIYTASANVANIGLTYNGTHSRYVIAKWNISVLNLTDLENLQVQTGGAVSSMQIAGADLKADAWNDIKLIIDTKDSSSVVYLNGELYQNWVINAGQFLTDETDGKKSFRIRVAGTSPITFAVDDFEMYTTPVLKTMYDAKLQPNWAKTNISSSTTQTGYLGKDATDESVIYTASANVANIGLTYTGAHSRYVIAKWNISISDLSLLNNLQVQSASGTSSMEIGPNLLNANSWNNIELIIDTAAKKSWVYLNGVWQTDCGKSGEQFLTAENYSPFRIRVDGKSPITFAVDDFEMYTTDVLTIDREVFNDANQPSWLLTNVSEPSVVKGYLGKDSSDESIIYTANDNTVAANIRLTYPGVYSKYVVAKWNFSVNDVSKFQDLQITTDGNGASMYVGNAISSNEWHNVILLIDTETAKSKVYLDGALYQDWKDKSGQFLSDYAKTAFRIRFAYTEPITFAVDDFEMYTSTVLPDVEMNKDFKFLSGSYITSADTALYKSGTTVDSVLADSKYQAEGAIASIYDAATGMAVTTGDMPESAKLALRTDDSTINTYELIALDGIRAWDNGDGAKKGFAFADSGIMIAARYVNGKFMSLTPFNAQSGMIEAQMSYTGEDGEEIKFFVWDSLTGMTPIYPAVTAD